MTKVIFVPRWDQPTHSNVYGKQRLPVLGVAKGFLTIYEEGVLSYRDVQVNTSELAIEMPNELLFDQHDPMFLYMQFYGGGPCLSASNNELSFKFWDPGDFRKALDRYVSDVVLVQPNRQDGYNLSFCDPSDSHNFYNWITTINIEQIMAIPVHVNRTELEAWCRDNAKGRWRIASWTNKIGFQLENDALHYKLRWHGD